MDILEESKKIYTKQRMQNNCFGEVDTAFLFTNEMISGYMKDLEGKSILTVASSGDHYFNALLKGATKVDMFDINYCNKLVIYLKKAGFENLNYDEFCMFFGLYDIHHIFDYDIYKMFHHSLNDEATIYWNYLYELAKHQGYSIYESDIIADYHDHYEEVIEANAYFKEEEFLILKKKLKEIPDISFTHADVNELPFLLHENYNSMFLSNIGTYQKNTTFMKTVRKLSKHLKENGEIYFAYIYENPGKKDLFYSKLLNSSHYRVENISSKLNGGQAHKVYIYKK